MKAGSPSSPAVIGPGGLRIVAGSETLRFEGKDHGAGISFFLVTNNSGEGPDLHRHPYSETWTILEGTARFTIDDSDYTAGGGDTLVVGSGVWHRFENAGSSQLVVMCVHASPCIIQEWKPRTDLPSRPSAAGQPNN